jgi:hypothetical protein
MGGAFFGSKSVALMHWWHRFSVRSFTIVSYYITYILTIQDRSRARRELKEQVADRCHQCISAVDLARPGAADLPLRV